MRSGAGIGSGRDGSSSPIPGRSANGTEGTAGPPAAAASCAAAPASMAAAGPAKVTLGKPKERCTGKFPNLAMTRGGFLSAQPAADDETELVLRDPASGAVVRKLEIDGLCSVAVSPDGSLIAIGRTERRP